MAGPLPAAGAVGQHAALLGPNKLINRAEFIRLLEQSLYRLGYDGLAQQLEQASVSWRSAHINQNKARV